MNPPAHPSATRLRLGWGLALSILALQFASRYLPCPAAVWVADDWANASRSPFYASALTAAATGLQDPNRPLSMAAVELGYRLIGPRAWGWTLVSLAANSLLLLAILKMALELTGRRRVAAAAGMVFALLPNLTETYHWSTQVLNEVSCGLLFYAVSGWLWVAHLRRGGAWRLALSALAYGIGLFSYEAGILLPGAYVLLVAWRREPLKGALRLAPFGLVGLAYAAWRTTNAFGWNQVWHYPPHMQAGVSWEGIRWSAREVAHWWGGEHFIAAARAGFRSFAALPAGLRLGLVAVNALGAAGIGWGLRRLAAQEAQENPAPPFRILAAAGFAGSWALAAAAISFLSYAAPRLNVLPAIGVALLAALALARLPFRAGTPVLCLLALLAMAANQGTAESYRQAGKWNREIFACLQANRDQWRGKEIVLFDTASLRRRLPESVAVVPDSWAHHGNAPLARGFTFRGMVKLAAGRKEPGVVVLHDAEHGARIDGDRLVWHARYDPTRPRTNRLADVFIVDAAAVAAAVD